MRVATSLDGVLPYRPPARCGTRHFNRRDEKQFTGKVKEKWLLCLHRLIRSTAVMLCSSHRNPREALEHRDQNRFPIPACFSPGPIGVTLTYFWLSKLEAADGTPMQLGSHRPRIFKPPRGSGLDRISIEGNSAARISVFSATEAIPGARRGSA
jgi:hypothetical protein